MSDEEIRLKAAMMVLPYYLEVWHKARPNARTARKWAVRDALKVGAEMVRMKNNSEEVKDDHDRD